MRLNWMQFVGVCEGKSEDVLKRRGEGSLVASVVLATLVIFVSFVAEEVHLLVIG